VSLAYGAAKDRISGRAQNLLAAGVDFNVTKNIILYAIFAENRIGKKDGNSIYFSVAAGRNETLVIHNESDYVGSISIGFRIRFNEGLGQVE